RYSVRQAARHKALVKNCLLSRMRTIRYQITDEDEGRRVDDFLIRGQGISRRVIVTLKQQPDGMMRCGIHVRTVDRLHAGDILEINLPEQQKRIPLCDIVVPILYEDEDVIVFNKPADMPVHQSGGHIFNTLDGVYAAHCALSGEIAPLRALNRLDKDTTGAVVAAQNQIAAGKLWKSVTKRYIAVVEGIPKPSDGTVDLPIEREIPMEQRRIVTPEGQRAVTHYRTLSQGDNAALLEFRLETGRTHQIRVHMAHIGYPLVGDTFYGSESPLISRQALHCAMVEFPHPMTGIVTTVEAPLPEDIKALLQTKKLCYT
ncbi:MAG: RluA family pseudouridine synthase, partial [Angelakisella sp.]